MGVNHSNTKSRLNICNTPPKKNTHRLLFDPRSPSDGISRTPIQIDSQVPVPPLRFYNHVLPHIIGPDINISEDNNENIPQEQEGEVDENEQKRASGVEPTLDPTKVLTDLVANNNGQLPPYQL